VVYFDKSISKSLKVKLLAFFDNFKNIKNLNISVTRNIDNANYLIKSSNEKFSAENYNLKTEREKENFAFNNGSYNITRGGFSRIKSCILKINTNSNKINIQEKTLKQLFFLSLGRFFSVAYFRDNQSLISPIYVNSDSVSKLDLLILKIHYNYIFHESINSSEYKNILRTFFSDI
jgi:hypothetical protein